MIRSYKSPRRRMHGRNSFLKAVAKNVLLIVSICVFIKFLSLSGADSFCEKLFNRIFQNESVVSTILGFEMGYTEPLNIPLINAMTPQSSPAAGATAESAQNTDTFISEMPQNGESAGIVPESSASDPTESIEFTDMGDLGISDLLSAGVGGEIKDLSGYNIDFSKYLSLDTSLSTDYSDVTVLIIHTHGSEAYKPEGEDIYVASDPSRTEDCNYNMIRVGNELTAILESRGIKVIHDTSLYDYPSYNGSYTRSLDAIVSYLESDPSIKIVIDLHRDAVNEGDNPYKTTTTINGESSSQVMIIAGTDGTGLWHPYWEENLKFALLLQGSMNIKYPSLARPLYVTNARYNQHATTGSLIVEVGYNGNTLQESLRAVRYFGDCMADVVTTLRENSLGGENG